MDLVPTKNVIKEHHKTNFFDNMSLILYEFRVR